MLDNRADLLPLHVSIHAIVLKRVVTIVIVNKNIIRPQPLMQTTSVLPYDKYGITRTNGINNTKTYLL